MPKKAEFQYETVKLRKLLCSSGTRVTYVPHAEEEWKKDGVSSLLDVICALKNGIVTNHEPTGNFVWRHTVKGTTPDNLKISVVVEVLEEAETLIDDINGYESSAPEIIIITVWRDTKRR